MDQRKIISTKNTTPYIIVINDTNDVFDNIVLDTDINFGDNIILDNNIVQGDDINLDNNDVLDDDNNDVLDDDINLDNAIDLDNDINDNVILDIVLDIVFDIILDDNIVLDIIFNIVLDDNVVFDIIFDTVLDIILNIILDNNVVFDIIIDTVLDIIVNIVLDNVNLDNVNLDNVNLDNVNLDDVNIDEFEQKIISQKINKEANQKLRANMDDYQTTIRDDLNKNNTIGIVLQTNEASIDQKITQSERVVTSLNLINNEMPIGDVSLEQVVGLLSHPSQDMVHQRHLTTSHYKKNFFVLEFDNPNSRIIKYCVFALFLNKKTYVLTTINKRDMDETIITYTESLLDPTQIIDAAYLYEKQKNRSLYIKRFVRQENNPERLQDLMVDQILENPINQLFTGVIEVTNIDPELINLNIIIKNGTYISTTEFASLNAFITVMMIF